MQELRPGVAVGEYVLVSPLGEGGFARVWLAQHKFWPERRVAAKIIRDPEQLESLRAEARCLAALAHPNIAGAVGIDLDHDPPYLLVDLHEGKTLRKILDEGPLSSERARAIFSQIVAALEASHAAGVTHGDLKPENVLVAPGDRVKVADFGLGRVTARQASLQLSQGVASTEGRSVAGTIPYMAPEQQAGEPACARTDVFTLGVLLAEISSGARPQPGDELTGSLGADPAWKAAFARCYARRERRFENAGALARALFERSAPEPSPRVAAPLTAAPPREKRPLWTIDQIEAVVAREAEVSVQALQSGSILYGRSAQKVAMYLLHHNLGLSPEEISARYGMPARAVRARLAAGLNEAVLSSAAQSLAPLPPEVTRRLSRINRSLVAWFACAIVALVLGALGVVGGAISLAVTGEAWPLMLVALGCGIALVAGFLRERYIVAKGAVDRALDAVEGEDERAKLERLAMRYDLPLVRWRARALLDGEPRVAPEAPVATERAPEAPRPEARDRTHLDAPVAERLTSAAVASLPEPAVVHKRPPIIVPLPGGMIAVPQPEIKKEEAPRRLVEE